MTRTRRRLSPAPFARHALPWRAALLAVAVVASSLGPTPAGAPRVGVGGGPGSGPSVGPPGQGEPDARSIAAAEARIDSPADRDAEEPPSTTYEQAVEHAGDPSAFAPGGTVDLGFVPAADDPEVDGGDAVPLPAGSASGELMAAEVDSDVWAAGAAPPSVDARASLQPSDPLEMSPVAFASSRPQVLGFLPWWELATARLRYDLLTTVAYFGVGVDPRGRLQKRDSAGALTPGWGGWTSSAMAGIIATAHRNHVRVVLTVQMFAWTRSGAASQSALLSSRTARARLAGQIAAAVRDRGADGVNLDFEPIASGQRANYVALVRSVRSALSRVSRGYELTVDATGSIGRYDVAGLTARGAADAVVIMGYDYRTATSAKAGSVAPLASPEYDLGDTIAAFRARTSASHLILALPWYGRAWSTRTTALHAPSLASARYGTSGIATYEVAADLARLHGRRYDGVEASAWTVYRRETCTKGHGCVTTWRQLYFEDARSLGAKLSAIKAASLRGTAIWALGYDGGHPDLWKAYEAVFPGTPPTGRVVFPAAGKTTVVGASATIRFSASGSVLGTPVVRLYHGRRGAAGSCSGVTWHLLWTKSSTSPLKLTRLSRTQCYRVTVTVTDGRGRSTTFPSGILRPRY